jgi:hypothetical protein
MDNLWVFAFKTEIIYLDGRSDRASLQTHLIIADTACRVPTSRASLQTTN